jgi:predicted nucleotidyltransferase
MSNILESDIRILTLLIGMREDTFTIKKIAETLKINYRIAYERVGVLEKEGLLKITKAGNSKICKFTGKFLNKVYEAEYYRREALFKNNKDFQVLRNRLAELNFVFVALLFGSHAKGTANKHSDIDILTIGGDKKAIETSLALWPKKVHLTTVTVEEFINMAKSKEFSVVSEAIKNNIILIGIGEYYRLIKNAE